jgi:farnesyl-diphosphate farnesyltransferase
MLLSEGRALRPAAWASIIGHARRTISGLIVFATRSGSPSEVQLDDAEDVRRYAYVAAGLLGELVTELFVEGGHVPRSARLPLWRCANAFGEGLELVSTTSDSADARPASRPRAELAAIAAEDLGSAELYVRTLRRSGAGFGIVSYAHLPLRRLRQRSSSERNEEVAQA